MGALHVRPATRADLEAINAIYNHYVASSTCTFQLDPEPISGRTAWFDAHGPAHPIMVAAEDGEVIGWASLSPYNSRCGYRTTVEDSVYVRHDRHGRGAGRALLADLIERARALGHHTIIAGIAGDQRASVALHERFGFTQVACLREVGFKFDRWLDVVYLQLLL